MQPFEPIESAATSEGVPVAPSMGPSIENLRIPAERAAMDRRVVMICAGADRAHCTHYEHRLLWTPVE
jgi:hypothetical protein